MTSVETNQPEAPPASTRPRPSLPRDPDRIALLALAVAMAVSGALLLWLSRNGTFFVDELHMFGTSLRVDFPEWIVPWNGHLSITSRVIYKAILEVFGADYLVVRILTMLSALLTAGVFFALARRRVGSLAALAPTIILLFFGSSWKHLLVGTGITVLLTIASGLGALLALEREDRRGDIVACLLLTFSVASFSVGLAFLAGAIVAVLLRPGRWRSAWVFLVPLLLYTAWWVWARKFSGPEAEGASVLLIPMWILESLGAVAGGLLGVNLGHDLSLPLNVEITTWGRAAGLAFLAAVAWRATRGPLPRSFWVSVTVALVYWSLSGLIGGGDATRAAGSARYVYPGAVVLLLVGTDAFRGIRLSTRGLAVLFGVVAFSLFGNLALLRAGSHYFREYGWQIRSELGMVELAHANVSPDYAPPRAIVDNKPVIDAGTYLRAVGRFGSPAFGLADLRRQPERVRQHADAVLAQIYHLGVTPATGRRGAGCETVRSPSGGAVTFKIPAGSSVRMEVRGVTPASISLKRFGDAFYVAGLGQLAPKAAGSLSLPADAAPEPWQAQVQVASLLLCRTP